MRCSPSLLAALFYFVADRFDKIAAATRQPATHLAIGAFASGVAAAMTLAFVMALDRGYLTVAFAVTALTTAIFATVDRIPLLRYVVVAIGFIVLGRLAWDPRIMGADVGTWPIFNWLLLGYGAPAVAFLAAGHILKREAEDLAVRICDALGLLFAALLVFFQIRHALNDGDPLAPASGHVEQGLFALTSLGFAAALDPHGSRAGQSRVPGRIDDLRRDLGPRDALRPWRDREPAVQPRARARAGDLQLAAARLPVCRRWPPSCWRAPRVVCGRNGTSPAPPYWPCCFCSATSRSRCATPSRARALTIWQSTGAPEIWSYSVAWLGLGLAFLGYGLWRGSKEARLASAALVVLSVLKVFLYDLTGIGGFWRAFSVICLGGVLIGIGLVYQKLVFARPQAPPPG